MSSPELRQLWLASPIQSKVPAINRQGEFPKPAKSVVFEPAAIRKPGGVFLALKSLMQYIRTIL